MNPLEERTILVQLKISTWTGRKKDKSTTEEVLHTAKAEKDAGSWWTYLVPKSVITSIETKAHRIRQIHYQYTLPWIENARILPLEAFLEYQEQIAKAIGDFNAAVDQFLAEYPTKMEQYRQRLGKLSQTASLPSVEEIKGRFKVSIDTLPFPSIKDFRVDISNQIIEEQIKQQVEKTIGEKIQSALQELYGRMAVLLAKVKNKLDSKGLREATIENLTDFCRIGIKLNFAKNSEFETICKQILTLFDGVSARDLRENKVLLYNIQQKIEEQLTKIDQLINSK